MVKLSIRTLTLLRPLNTLISMLKVSNSLRLYIAELVSDADTVSISETWLRPGELCIIKHTL